MSFSGFRSSTKQQGASRFMARDPQAKPTEPGPEAHSSAEMSALRSQTMSACRAIDLGGLPLESRVCLLCIDCRIGVSMDHLPGPSFGPKHRRDPNVSPCYLVAPTYLGVG